MKLLRYGPPKSEKPGLLDAKGVIRDLSAHVQDISPATVTPQELARIAALDYESLPIVGGTPRLGVPVKGIGNRMGVHLDDFRLRAGQRHMLGVIFHDAQ